jgi:BASS family bile acid:Na+ symporter
MEMKEQLEGLSDLTINFGEGGMMIVNFILAFVMFGVALGIKTSTFKEVFKKPKSVIAGVFLQWVGLPAVTFAVALVLNPWITPMIALGMILVACCPGGNISNFISSLSKGNVELSISMTAITTAFAPIVTPFNFWLWGTLYSHFAEVHNDIPMLDIPFLPMLEQIMLLLGVPIIAGLIFAKYFPNATKKITKPAQVLSILLFIGMVTVSFSQNWQIFLDNIIYVFFIVLFHNACALGTGFFGGRLLKLPEKDYRSLTVEVGIQNSGLGLILLFNEKIFPPEVWHGHYGGMLLVAAWCGIWHIISGLTVAYLFRRKPLNE